MEKNSQMFIGLFTNEPALIQYLQDVKSEGIMSIEERKKLFEIQHTHGMEMNMEIELNSSIN
ncbi:MAG: hypothetical protein LBI60_04730 [Bacteroidales bacterium]|jgi:hypothetical protein|nr:hypothetical protein [Bacteroidales bacterium]